MKRPSKPNLEEERAIKEERRRIGLCEYQIADYVRCFVPIYYEADRSKAKQFWKLAWDAPDLLGFPLEEELAKVEKKKKEKG